MFVCFFVLLLIELFLTLYYLGHLYLMKHFKLIKFGVLSHTIFSSLFSGSLSTCIIIYFHIVWLLTFFKSFKSQSMGKTQLGIEGWGWREASFVLGSSLGSVSCIWGQAFLLQGTAVLPCVTLEIFSCLALEFAAGLLVTCWPCAFPFLTGRFAVTTKPPLSG